MREKDADRAPSRAVLGGRCTRSPEREIGRIKPSSSNGRSKIVAMHTSEQVAVPAALGISRNAAGNRRNAVEIVAWYTMSSEVHSTTAALYLQKCQ
jgi:hypothetical protein